MVKPAMLLTFLLIGAWNTSQFFHAGYQVLWTSLLSFAGCALLLAFAKNRIEASLWVWALLGVFIMGYYVKLLMMSHQYTTYKFDVYYATEMGWLTVDAMLRANWWMTVGFLTFCVVGSILISLSRVSIDGQRQRWFSLRVQMLRVENLLFAIAGLSILTLFIPVIYGFGQMGMEHHCLPFRLDAVVTRIRLDLLPCLLLLLLWLLDRKQHRGAWFITLLLFIVLSLGDSAMRGSRSAVLLAILPALMLWILSGKLSRPRMAVVAASLVMTMVFYPVFSNIRTTRMAGGDVDATTVVEGLTKIGSSETWVEIIDMVAMRVGGLDGLIHDIEHGPEGFDPSRLSWLLNNETMATYQTYDVVGVGRHLVDGRSPGLLGAFVLVAGPWGIVPLVTLYMVLIWMAWTKTASLPIAPVALSYLMSRLIMYTSEGTFGIQSPIAWFVSIMVTSYVFSWLLVPTASPSGFRPGWHVRPSVNPRSVKLSTAIARER